MKQKEEEKSTQESVIDTSLEQVTTIDKNTLSIEELIAKVSLLTKNDNPYTASKEIEEIKSIFYIKLKLEQKENTTPEETEEQEENIKKELHPLEVKFKAVFGAYRKIKSDFRKTKEKEEENNLKTKNR